MPTPPPLSPSPRRPASSTPHPEFAALLSSFENAPSETASTRRASPEQPEQSTGGLGGFPSWLEQEGQEEHEDLPQQSSSGDEAYATPRAESGATDIPEIRTTSPTPLRPNLAGRSESPARSNEGRLSPLVAPPDRSQLFGRAAETRTFRSMSASRVPRGEP